jgi:hypothetical protein
MAAAVAVAAHATLGAALALALRRGRLGLLLGLTLLPSLR